MGTFSYVFIGLFLFLIGDYFINNFLYEQHSLYEMNDMYIKNKEFFKYIKIYPAQKCAYFYSNILSSDTFDIYKINYEDFSIFIKDISFFSIPIFYDYKINYINLFLKLGGIFVIFIICYNFITAYLYISKSGTNSVSSFSLPGQNNEQIFKIVKYNSVQNIDDIDNINNIDDINKVKNEFDEIIGMKSTKKELSEYINFMKYRNQYIKVGYTIPKGLLFIGPPGTGKTHMARLFAKQSGANFIITNGSQFAELYVGTAAKRVRELFTLAKSSKEPTVIFIDEIDSIGAKRSLKPDSGSMEHNSGLNALLVEIDGFSETDNVLVIGSTNMHTILDPALIRSGRLEKQIIFESPNKEERIDIFKLYLNKVKCSSLLKINYDDQLLNLSKMTAGLCGADIKKIVNQGVYNYFINVPNKQIVDVNDATGVTLQDLMKSIDEVIVGMEKPERKMSEIELKRTAYHEAGHTLIAYLLNTTEPPLKTSIIPRGINILGFAQQTPSDKKMYLRSEIFGDICVLFGGRACEKIIFGDISTGASDDFKKIDNLVKQLLNNCRFNSLGYTNNKKKTHKLIKNILIKLNDKTKQMINDNIDCIHKIALFLLEHETILCDDIELILGETLRKSIISKDLLNN